MFGFRVVLTLIIFITICVIATRSNGGSTIFYKRNARDCWTRDDIAKLQVRRIFENLLPSSITPNKVDQKYIRNILRYFRDSLRAVNDNSDQHVSALMREALSDTIGGYLRSELLPTVRFAYYAGYIPHRSARMLHDFFDELKANLNTKGLGWNEPDKVPQWSNLSVFKILIGPGIFDSCSRLVTKRDSNSCFHLPPPKLDDPKQPSAIALPFKTGGFVSLTSLKSENIILKYYTTTSRCILNSSPQKCRHSDFVNFNNELWHWMKRDVAPHLVDEKLYSAYGGILRIATAVQSYGKGLSRRNLFEYKDAGFTKWHPWQLLTKSHLYVNTDWTPKVYIALVLLAALAICFLQTCYHYIFGDASCQCKEQKKEVKDVSYANVDSSFPAMLPSHQSTVYFMDQKIKPISSLASLKTQKVYDLNENTEKLMAVMSDKEESQIHSTPSKHESEINFIHIDKTKQMKTLPEIETSMTQLRVKSTPRKPVKNVMYSTSTLTHSDLTHMSDHERQSDLERQVSESGSWSESTSCTSDQMISSRSSKQRTSTTRSTRDLAWARRVISKSN